MSVTPDLIRNKLIAEIGAIHVDVEDTSPNRCAASFKVLVVSPQFEGKPLLQRHRIKLTPVEEYYVERMKLCRQAVWNRHAGLNGLHDLMHWMVNNCLAEELKEIHAFEQKTLTPEQWEKQKAQ